ncbi:E3 SUMO-protein ligase ZBED1-like [Gigantopelta aegis]|uniref:E3 SUMO-protein ligase ZBED1-like n=1 Tax=Gigantopelta aegis TaxID=1735272 RepID=UPI001B888070|nr:E3 SUMO-protein ligase ZBED1-like [Gigantopelta aegis]
MKEELVRLLNKQIGVALTCDHWTSCAVEGYVTVTAHFVDDEFYYHNCVLETRQTTERHTGMNIAQDLKVVISEFGIEKEGVTALVSDNASNMVACMEHMGGIMHIRCFGHTLQLSIRGAFDDIPSISGTIVAGRKLVSYFRRSVVANNELKVRQKQMHLTEHSLVLDCPTRWNSTFDMFERLIEQRLSVYAVVHNMKSPGDARILDLTDSHWTIIEGMIPVLKPLYMATRIMCSEEYPTISGLDPILYSLKNHHLLVKDTDCVSVATFKEKLLADIHRRYSLNDDKILSSLTMLATFLDPRYKNLPFLSDEQRETVKANVLSGVNALQIPNDYQNNPSQIDASTSASPTVSADADGIEPCLKYAKMSQDEVSFLLGPYFNTEECEIIVPTSSSEELALYMTVKPIGTNKNPFDWWRLNKTVYPTLAVLARHVLSVPATSVPSERVFSVAGGTVTKLRASLDSDSVDKLIFLNKSIRDKNVQQEKAVQESAATALVKQEPVK